MLTMFGVSVGSHWLQNAGVTLTHHPWNMLIGFVEVALLAGLIRCGGCRYAMRRTMITYTLASGEKRKVATYSCQRKHTGGDCPAPAHVMASTIEPIVIRHFAWWHFHSERAGASRAGQ